MVDMDKHACRQLAENGYKNGQWPEDYITWEFLANHPRAMESGYFHVDWNTIPRLYNRCSNWKNPPLEKTLPFTGAQNLWLLISNSEEGAQKNGYYHSLP